MFQLQKNQQKQRLKSPSLHAHTFAYIVLVLAYSCSAAVHKSMFNFGVRASFNVLVKLTHVLHQKKRPRHAAFFFLPSSARSGGGDLFYRRRRAETGSEARQRLIIARLDALSMCARPASSRDFDRLLAEGTLERVARTGHTLNWHVIASLCFSNGFPADAHALKRTGT
jgi:hypothetical protein